MEVEALRSRRSVPLLGFFSPLFLVWRSRERVLRLSLTSSGADGLSTPSRGPVLTISRNHWTGNDGGWPTGGGRESLLGRILGISRDLIIIQHSQQVTTAPRFGFNLIFVSEIAARLITVIKPLRPQSSVSGVN